jgi:soluble lytic murein transglycosylase-like protein
MITLGLCQFRRLEARPVQQKNFFGNIRRNILHQFCFKLIFASLAAGALFGAGPDSPRRVTSVVRPDLRTGKLVRSILVSSKPVAEVRVAEAVVLPRVVDAGVPEAGPVAPPAGLDEAVRRIAAENSLSPQLIHSVIKVESNYNPHAISSKGALGLMQLIPATARRFGVSDVFNPVQNIQGGARYLRYLLDLYSNDYPLALAAYNAGEAAVARYGGVPPFAETQNYVLLVRRQLEQAKKAAAAKAAAPPPAVESKEAGPAHVVEIVQADGSVRYVSR